MDYHKAEQKRINDEIERLEFEIAEADINRRRTINLNQRRIAELRQEQYVVGLDSGAMKRVIWQSKDPNVVILRRELLIAARIAQKKELKEK